MTSSPPITDGWIRGWPAIRRYLGGYRSLEPIKDMVDNYGLPIRTLPTGEPVMIVSEVNRWLQVFSEVSSPFRLKRLSGAALLATQGVKVGSLKTNKKSHDTLMSRTFPNGEADLWGDTPHT
jgi:hypothetical protein